jgi:hypothetical protein
LAVVAAGCRRTPVPAGTGAGQVARHWYEALLRQDWAEAYHLLHADSRARCTEEQFARLAQNHRRTLGFESEAVRLSSCDEKGDEAIAHVVLTGRAGNRQRYYRDAVVLRRGAEAWGVVLPPRFGLTR